MESEQFKASDSGNLHVRNASTRKESRPAHVVIIGGGLGGLAAAAIILAAQKVSLRQPSSSSSPYNVTLFEKSPFIGGRALCKKMDGYTLDFGIHALRGAENGPAAQVLRMIGKSVEFAVKNSDGVLPKIYYKGRFADAPYTTARLLKYPLLGFSEKMKLVKIAQTIPKKVDPSTLDGVTVSEWLRSMNVSDESLITHLKLFASIGFYCDADFDKMSAGELVRFFQRYPYDAGYPKGGWRQIIDKLALSVKENGGRIVTGKQVDGIAVSSDKKVIGVMLRNGKDKEEKEYVEADYVILNVPARFIPSIIEPSFIPPDLHAALQEHETSAGIVIDMGVSKELLKNEKADIVLVPDPVSILRVSSKYDNSIVPKGRHLLTAWMPINSTLLGDSAKVESKFAELEKIIREVFPGIFEEEGIIDFKRKMVLDTVIGRYPGVRAHGGSSSSACLTVKFPGIDNLYVVGDAVTDDVKGGIGGSSDAAFLSALKCAELIQKKI